MKAALYIQGRFYATIDVPADGLLALLAKGMITNATAKANQLKHDLELISGVHCTISLHFKEPVSFTPTTELHL